MKKTLVLILVVLTLLIFTTPAYAVIQAPHAFFGSVTVNGVPAPNGTQVSGTVSEGTAITNAHNPVTTADGNYGINSPYLLIQGNIPDGATITFSVNNANGVATGGTAVFKAGGGPTRYDISVTFPVGGGGGVAPPVTTTVTPTSTSTMTVDSTPMSTVTYNPTPTMTSTTPPTMTPTPTPTVSPTLTPTMTPTPTPTVTPTVTPTSTLTVKPKPPPTVTPTPTLPATNWGLIVGIIVSAVVVVGSAIFLIIRRRAP